MINKTEEMVLIQPKIQLCGGFNNRKLSSLEVIEAPQHVFKHILNCEEGDTISVEEFSDILHELILYGYEVRILSAKRETIPPINWI